jgi:hypothetical protein
MSLPWLLRRRSPRPNQVKPVGRSWLKEYIEPGPYFSQLWQVFLPGLKVVFINEMDGDYLPANVQFIIFKTKPT